MSQDKYDREIEFNRLMARNKHLEKIISRYKQVEEWENLREGDAIIIDNSDSLHNGQRGKFLAHDWAIAGYVRLFVAFPDGKNCYYLPTQVVRVYEEKEPIEQPTPAPVAVSEPESQPTSESSQQPEKEKKGIDFRKYDPEKLEAKAIDIIEAKLAQVAKIPIIAAREKILSSTLDASLVPRALEIARERGIIPS